MLTATDQKPQKIIKRHYYPVTILTSPEHVNVSVINSAFYDFAVFDPSPLTVCINCSFLNIYICYFITRFK